MPNDTILEMNASMLRDKVKALPKEPGVYKFRDEVGRIVYVGKAKNLKNRVGSYFSSTIPLGSKTKLLVDSVRDLEVIPVQSELEALLLEAKLIKTYKPRYNISLKDDKSYKYIVILNSKMDGINFPIVTTARKLEKSVKYYYGPFPDGGKVNEVIRSVRKVIPFRDCSPTKFQKYKKTGSPCLYGHLGLCSSPCVNFADNKKYLRDITLLKRFLSGDAVSFQKSLSSLMQVASRKQNYELAAYYRDKLEKYSYVTQGFRDVSNYIQNPNLVADTRTQALSELGKNLEIITKHLIRIECYDISNISGKDATASMVVAIEGKLRSDQYKRFKIRTKDTPDDFLMIKEVIRRRFTHKTSEIGWSWPDLLVIDGGKGQVSSVLGVLSELSIEIPVVGLAKRFERLVYFQNGDYKEIDLERSNEGLKLIQALRDEAHRFARKYHHMLRMKSLLKDPDIIKI